MRVKAHSGVTLEWEIQRVGSPSPHGVGRGPGRGAVPPQQELLPRVDDTSPLPNPLPASGERGL